MRLVHLAPASAERSIRRSGLRAPVFAMPIMLDWSATYQWLREMRRWRDRERMLAVHVRVPDDEPVLVGRYGTRHARTTATEAARRVRERPAGIEIIVERSIGKRDVLAIREVPQLVGWTETPDTPHRSSCVCRMCVQRGMPGRARRIRVEYTRTIDALVRPGLVARGIEASRLEDVAEAAKGKLDAKPLLRFATDPDPAVRTGVARALAWFTMRIVEAPLGRLVSDDHSDVRAAAARALVRSAGPIQAMRIAPGSDEVRAAILDDLGYRRPTRALVTVLATMANARPDDPRIDETARAWLEDGPPAAMQAAIRALTR